eukprot:4260781-Prymnesium_polylepis.1
MAAMFAAPTQLLYAASKGGLEAAADAIRRDAHAWGGHVSVVQVSGASVCVRGGSDGTSSTVDTAPPRCGMDRCLAARVNWGWDVQDV